MMAWCDIADAPLDGSKVDLWIVDRNGYPGRVPDAWYENGQWWHDTGDIVQAVLAPEAQEEGDRITHFFVLAAPE